MDNAQDRQLDEESIPDAPANWLRDLASLFTSLTLTFTAGQEIIFVPKKETEKVLLSF